MNNSFDVIRAQKLIKRAISKLNLQLTGLKILTEAGSNYFIYTPLIAYYAGASKIFVWIRDTKYGSAISIKQEFENIIFYLQLDSSVFDIVLNERPEEHISTVDIVTNLGFVRPLNKEFISLMKHGSVISYMCEAWEIRSNDVDISYCNEKGITVAGVWENHPDFLIFNGCGPLALKLCHEAGFEVYQNNILVISSDKFGQVAYNTFKSIGAEVSIISPNQIDSVDFTLFDFLFIAEYSYQDEIIGKAQEYKIEKLRETAIIHLCGAVDYLWLKEKGVYCYPKQDGYNFRMTRTLAYLGIKPLIDLHAAGLSVGESIYKKRENELVQII
jgi:hypothetical protein